jgi:hypothetical protein
MEGGPAFVASAVLSPSLISMVCYQPSRSTSLPHRRAISSPPPLSGMGHRNRPDGIADHIAAVRANAPLTPPELTLKQMPHLLISAMVRLRIPAIH